MYRCMNLNVCTRVYVCLPTVCLVNLYTYIFFFFFYTSLFVYLPANPPSIYTGPGVAGPSALLSYEQPPAYVNPADQPPAYLPPLTSEKTPIQ